MLLFFVIEDVSEAFVSTYRQYLKPDELIDKLIYRWETSATASNLVMYTTIKK